RLTALALLVMALGSGARADSVQAQINAYVTNANNNTVAVIDTASNTIAGTNTVSVVATATNTVVATVPVGSIPFGMAITPDGAFVYVVNLRGNSVSV